MTIPRVSFAILFAIISIGILSPRINAKVLEVKVVNDDRKIVLVARPYQFTQSGVIELHINNDKVFLPEGSHFEEEGKSKFGFFMTTAAAVTGLEMDLSKGACVLDDPNIEPLFTFRDLALHRNVDGSEWTFDYMKRISTEKAGEYTLYFANCYPKAVVSFTARVSLYNEGSLDGRIE
eukprot:CAMPEP_0196582232 /NCGR_PEP_ID=MMETSP1081-20130531/38126_1 /TAXON_ID=36882 /ORGANISM="Pyramimonas amylifera, Strain CCMP720" /LENGTH=177 /DNA_ID=CAMNT_0041902735 /DNA_START=54 /DNA_END=587 /DNA_ORIENTATION=+